MKVGDYIIVLNDHTLGDCKKKGKFKNQMGKIIKIKHSKHFGTIHHIDIIKCPYKKECQRYSCTFTPFCMGILVNQFQSLNKLKLKKLVEHGV